MGPELGAAGALGGLAQLASIGSAFWLGGRLIRRGLRGRATPELLLGAHLFLSIGVGSLLLTAVSLSSYSDFGIGAAGTARLAVAGNSLTIVGLMAALQFNSHVFHAGDRAGTLLALTGSALIWAGFAYLLRSGGLDDPATFDASYWPLAGAMVLADLWIAGEALHFRARLRKRLALGLAEPLVIERLGLWGCAAVARIGLVMIAPVVTWAVPSPAERAALAPPLLAVSALLILVTCVSYWLMLAPTAGYRRWVERRYAPAAR